MKDEDIQTVVSLKEGLGYSDGDIYKTVGFNSAKVRDYYREGLAKGFTPKYWDELNVKSWKVDKVSKKQIPLTSAPTYDSYMESDDWQTLRLERMKKTHCKCEICGTKSRSNDGHHVKYATDLRLNRVIDIRIVCRRCHEAVHLALKRELGINELMSDSESRWMATLRAIKTYKLLPEDVLSKLGKMKRRIIPKGKKRKSRGARRADARERAKLKWMKLHPGY